MSISRNLRTRKRKTLIRRQNRGLDILYVGALILLVVIFGMAAFGSVS